MREARAHRIKPTPPTPYAPITPKYAHSLLGDPRENASYLNYGRDIHAVADGSVVSVVDGLPENDGNACNLTFETLEELAGNHLVMDIGGGDYALYAHCTPGSIRQRPGDFVRAGEVIACVGNSGNSSGPHLRLQLMDGPHPFWSRGVPFVLDAHTKVGERGVGRLAPRRVEGALVEECTVFDLEDGSAWGLLRFARHGPQQGHAKLCSRLDGRASARESIAELPQT
jgi:murein DD-endopeptidase MepM/ murein hydrolase activator NlpD